MSSDWLGDYLTRTGGLEHSLSPPLVDLYELPEWHDLPANMGASSDSSEDTINSLLERTPNLPSVYTAQPPHASPGRMIPQLPLDLHQPFSNHHAALWHLNKLAIPCGFSVATSKQSYLSRGAVKFVCSKGYNSGKQAQQALAFTSKTGCTWKVGLKRRTIDGGLEHKKAWYLVVKAAYGTHNHLAQSQQALPRARRFTQEERETVMDLAGMGVRPKAVLAKLRSTGKAVVKHDVYKVLREARQTDLDGHLSAEAAIKLLNDSRDIYHTC